MHIGMVIDRLDVGGAEKVALTLTETFLDQGHTVTIVTIDNVKLIDIDERISLFSLDFKKRLNKYAYNRKKMHALLDTIQTERGTFDFILVHLYKASRVMQYYSKVQCFHIMHNTQSKSALKEKRGFNRWLVKRKIQNVYNGRDIICVSKGVEKDILNVMQVKPRSIRVIYNPFDIASIRRKAEEPCDLLFHDEYIIFVGRLTKEKRVDYLFRAYAKSNIGEKLLIVGDGSESESLKLLAKTLKIEHKVIFTGTVTNPYKYIKGAKFLVLSSLYEGFGNVLVEALILQTPVVSTNCPSGPEEILKHYTLDALVDGNFDNDALAEKMKRWSKTPVPVDAESMKIFSDTHVAQQYIGLYERTVHRSSVNKIRILFELSSLGYGGTEKAIYTFIENLDLSKFEPYLFFSTDYKTVAYYRRKIKSLFSNKAKKNFIEKYVTYFTRLDDFKKMLGEDKVVLGNAEKFFNTVGKLNPDIIHFNRGISETFYTKSIEKIPLHIKVVETTIFGKEADVKYMSRLDRIFFISNWLLKKTAPVSKNRRHLLYNPIKLPSSKTDLRNRYNIPQNAIVLGRMSRPNLDDGEFIYNVLENVLDNNIYFISIGASQAFQKKMQHHKNIIFFAPVIDVEFISSFYNTIDILLHYRREGETFGMNIAEAMIHGKPVISHKSFLDNAQAELLTEDKNCQCGIIVEENDLKGYIKAVKTLIDNKDLRTELSENAEIRAHNLFAEDKVTHSLEQEYLALCLSHDM